MTNYADDTARLSYALSKYGWTTPDIRKVLKAVFALSSDRTIKKRSRVDDNILKVGRKRASTKVKADFIPGLLLLAHVDPELFGGNMLHFLEAVHKRFDLTPRQFMNFAAEKIHRGGMTLRPCLRCGALFPSVSSGERIGPCCEETHRRALKGASMSIDHPDLVVT